LAVKMKGKYRWWEKRFNRESRNEGKRKRTIWGEIRLMEWNRKLVPDTRWSIWKLKRNDQFFIKRWCGWTSKCDKRWKGSAAKKL